jgi:glycosyltransferase involved in cell wall biosynthesis
MHLNVPSFSIITINYNNSIGLEKTLNSIISQNYNYELIVIDGGSTDNSIIVANIFINHIKTFISEKDNGIYDAMNKGLKYCNNDFLIFLNSGDTFMNSESLLNASLNIDKWNTGYFFNAIIEGYKIIPFKSPHNYSYVNYKNSLFFIPNHQATLFPKVYYKSNSYLTNLHICSDVDYIFRLSNFYGIKYINLDFVKFEIGGISSNFKSFIKTFSQIKESIYINKIYFKNKIFIFFYISSKFITKYILHNILGHYYYSLIKKLNEYRQRLFN